MMDVPDCRTLLQTESTMPAKPIGPTGWVCFAVVMASLSSMAAAQVKIDAPVDRANVNVSFYLQAQAASCESLPTTKMAYSVDSGADVMFPGTSLLQATVSVQNAGGHTLDIKAWNSMGSLCHRTDFVNVTDGVNVSAPAAGAIVTSPFVLQAAAPSCNGESTQSMAYELDDLADPHSDHGLGQPHEQDTQDLNRSVSSNTGAYLLRIKARGNPGSYCETDLPLTVATTSGLVPPSEVFKYDHVENDGNFLGTYAYCGGAIGAAANLWQTQPDCATIGTKSGSTVIVSSPTYGRESDSREFTMTYSTSGGGVRWFDKVVAGDTTATHFQYDAYINMVDNSKIGQLELDINHAITQPTKMLYILAAQCNLNKGLWQVTVRGKGWVNTNASCTRSQVASGVWHHFQIQTHHDLNGSTGIYYDAVAVDGHATPITSCTIASTGAALPCMSTSSNPGWAALIGPNFQIDGTGPGGSATAYVDDFTLYYW